MTYTCLDSYRTLTNYQVKAIEEVMKIIDSEYLKYLPKTNIILLDYESMDYYYKKLVSPEINIDNTLFKFGFVANDIVSIAEGKAIYISPNRFKYYTPKAIAKTHGASDSILTCRLLGILLMNIIMMNNPETTPIEALDLTLKELDKFSRLVQSKTELLFFYGLSLSYIKNEFLEFVNYEFSEILGEELI